ncbi:cysteine-rich receptor-like protein kinase 44 isoform X1 [Lotus japonicus]|uniref:cysteine-rich receptor-like protein kinase 44 isoform X1 n=1 Tax=Lotus japonicus TaxID=34305 RepID=UPI00258E2150|nr:cysteine-rich receptor-like protein kinase 44 isoform X1 [Lotus japonicus]
MLLHLHNHHHLVTILFSLFGITSLLSTFAESEQQPIYNYNYCPQNTTFDSTTTFQTNLRVLLSSLIATSQTYASYYSSINPGTKDVANGQFLCRADVSSAVCDNCITAAAGELSRRCPNKSQSIVWYDECMLGYTNRYYPYTETDPGTTLWGEKNVSASDLSSFNRTLFGLLGGLRDQASSSPSPTKFATREADFVGGGGGGDGGSSSSRRVYGLAQCLPDMTGDQCGQCLQNAIGKLVGCCGGKQGARVLLAWCNIRYELFQFYNSIGSSSSPGNKKSASRKIGLIVVLVVISIILLCCISYLLLRKSRKNYKTLLRENFGDESVLLESLQFSLATIEAATRKFSSENKIGKGGFGEVYKGILLDGREIAVKRLSQKSGQGVIEFMNEIKLIAKLQHRNLVILLGFCLEEKEKILIYEFVPNNSLDYFLFHPNKSRLLNWFERYRIIEGIARGVLYLHDHSRLKVIHRDLKPSNVLLDDNMNPKISDFGIARIVATDEEQGSTNRIVGTFGYMSPEYAMHGQFSEKSDVFSFGVIVLETISAKKNARSLISDNDDDLLGYAWRQWRDKTPLEILEQGVRESCNHSEVIKCIQIGLLCVQEKPDDRPTMTKVVSYLSSPLIELPFPEEPKSYKHSGVAQKMVAGESTSGSVLSMNEMSVSISIPR